MKRFILLLLVLVGGNAWGQEFEFTMEYDSIAVEIDGYRLPAPWTGGYERTQPVFVDIDNDLDYDLFLNDWRNLVFYLNDGNTADAELRLMTENYNNITAISSAWASPEFGDIDADGDNDLILGSGYVGFFENYGTSTVPLFSDSGVTLYDTVGDPVFGTTVALVDIDLDGDLDLFGGEYQGHIQFYRNVGTPDSFSYYLEDEDWLNLNVLDDADITFSDLDADDDFDLVVGAENGKLWYVENIGTPTQFDFADPVSNWFDIDAGFNSSPEFCDIDADGDFDLFVGRDADWYSSDPGDLFFYENIGDPQNPVLEGPTKNYLTIDAGFSNSPVLEDFDCDGDMDLLYSNQYKMTYFQNIGDTGSPYFEWVSDDFTNGVQPDFFDLYDLDDDGDLDMLCADGTLFSAVMHLYTNRGTVTEPDFVYVYSIQTPWDYIGMPDLVDIDADGDGDLLLNGGGGISFWENQGTPEQPDFVFITTEYAGLIYSRNGHFIDFDNDDDYDFVCGYNTWGTVEFWKNIGTPQDPDFILAEDSLLSYNTFYGPKPCCGDIDNDGDIDVFVGETSGGIRFFRNTTGDTLSTQPRLSLDPLHGFEFSFGPNPANPITWISYNLPYPQKAEIAVYNLLGQKVATLASGLQMPGQKTIIWDAANYASGQYFVRMETSGSGTTPTTEFNVGKVVVVK